jgi:hypothetical protein
VAYFLGGIAKAVKVASFTGKVTKAAAKIATKTVIHKNSKDSVGDTHVYALRDQKTGQIAPGKIGQSARGIRKSDGKSIRAEEQVRKLRKEGKFYESEIRRVYSNKAEALRAENQRIIKFRKLYGKDKLPLNKGDH